MLDKQKKRLADLYSKNILKLEPYLLRISGYNAQETRLKIDSHLLHCTPATFSLTSAKVILVLGPKEVEGFKDFEQNLISLNLSFDAAYFDKAVSFFLKGKMGELTSIRDNIYTLELELTSSSDTYEELFLHLSEITTLYNKVYNTELTEQQLSGVNKVPITYCQIVKDSQVFCYSKLNSVLPKFLELTLDETQSELNIEEKYKFIVTYNGHPLHLIGSVTEKNERSYKVTLELNMEYVHILTIYMNMGLQQSSEGKEELEEL